MHVRNAISSDFERIEHLFQLENRFNYDIEPNRVALTTDVLTRAELDEILVSNDALLAVCENNNVVTGLIFAKHLVSKGNRWMPDVNRVYIEELFVDEKHGHQGHASALINHVLDWAKSLDAMEIDLNVWSNNTGAVNLYTKLGFINKQLLMTMALNQHSV